MEIGDTGLVEGINLGKKGEVLRYFDGQLVLAVLILFSNNEANTRARNDIYCFEGLSQIVFVVISHVLCIEHRRNA